MGSSFTAGAGAAGLPPRSLAPSSFSLAGDALASVASSVVTEEGVLATPDLRGCTGDLAGEGDPPSPPAPAAAALSAPNMCCHSSFICAADAADASEVEEPRCSWMWGTPRWGCWPFCGLAAAKKEIM